jgi:hypothetical protein
MILWSPDRVSPVLSLVTHGGDRVNPPELVSVPGEDSRIGECGGGAREEDINGADGFPTVVEPALDREGPFGLAAAERSDLQIVSDSMESVAKTGSVTAETNTHLEDGEWRDRDVRLLSNQLLEHGDCVLVFANQVVDESRIKEHALAPVGSELLVELVAPYGRPLTGVFRSLLAKPADELAERGSRSIRVPVPGGRPPNHGAGADLFALHMTLLAEFAKMASGCLRSHAQNITEFCSSCDRVTVPPKCLEDVTVRDF